MPQHVPDRDLIGPHERSREQRRILDHRVLQPVPAVFIPAAHLDGDRVAVVAARMLLPVDASRSDAPRRIAVVHRLQPAVPVDKIMRRGPARGPEIVQIPRGGVIASGRVVQNEKFDALRPSSGVITRMRRRHASHPPRCAASAPGCRNKRQ